MTELVMVAIDDFEFDPDNPNEQDLATFNDLVDGMKRNGATTAVTGVRRDGKVLTIGGEHRIKAAKLAGLREYPTLLVPPEQFADDERQIEMVRENVIHGRLDPMKFTRLWQRLQGRYGPDALQKLMGFGTRDSELRRLVKDTGQSLPESMRADFARRTEKIRSVEDLAAVVQSLFARHGGTLEHSFVVFSFGGRTHAMIRCSPASFAPIQAFLDQCESDGRQADEALAELVGKEVVDAAPD